MKTYKYLKPVILGLMMFSSCNEDILEKDNPNQLSTGTFFTNEAELSAGVTAIYSGLQANNLYNREYFFLWDMLSDENVGTANLEPPRAAALNYNFDAGNKLVNDVWQGLYRVIHRANLVIDVADDIPEEELSVAARNRYVAQARFLRAWAYNDLVSLWGPVPLHTEPATPATLAEGFPRVPVEQIYQLIFEDLDFAEANLPTKSEWGASELGRVPKGAAQALKGKIHMFRGDYAAARTEFQKVISSGQYSLVPEFEDNFTEENENNAESIFEVQFSTAHGYGVPWNDGGDGQGIAEVTFRGQEYTPITGWNNVNPSPGLLSAYEEGDPRFDYTFYEDGEEYCFGCPEKADGTPYTMELSQVGWKKYSNAYKQGNENQISGINFRVIRYADVLLMMAEAVNELEGPAAAIEYVNQVRQRPSVDLPELAAPASKEEMFEIIARERRVELASEQVRTRDLIRWRKNGKLTSEPIANYNPSKHALLPIPAQELANNQALTNEDQNPNY
ncbi:RagB/SusD family nutrient uptake outer membrane protein [Cesiribacter sp. SM1]|uniref:RagB/SusD family nutrient uptake outer membrane protein n=1 Tax=Cesiribacter sp. SM1 TaxID=2861196 RepID=UPI001CD3CBD1|nr:RagB/SusD family nutrient uptake outer membrane protein [Cesiribacter sp. SM1]